MAMKSFLRPVGMYKVSDRQSIYEEKSNRLFMTLDNSINRVISVQPRMSSDHEAMQGSSVRCWGDVCTWYNCTTIYDVRPDYRLESLPVPKDTKLLFIF